MLKKIKDLIYRNQSKQKRIAPAHATRGRIYGGKDAQPFSQPAVAEPLVTMQMKVIRKDGTVEYHEADPNRITVTPQ